MAPMTSTGSIALSAGQLSTLLEAPSRRVGVCVQLFGARQTLAGILQESFGGLDDQSLGAVGGLALIQVNGWQRGPVASGYPVEGMRKAAARAEQPSGFAYRPKQLSVVVSAGLSSPASVNRVVHYVWKQHARPDRAIA